MLKGRVSGLFVASVCAALAFAVGNVSASKGAWEEYDKLIKSSEAIAALGPTLFGDQSNLQNGGLSFSVTDVSLKGNNGLPVAITRTFKTKTSGGAMKGTLPGSNRMDGAMGDWEIDLPFVGGVFAQSTGWINSAAGKAAQRCSVANTFEATPKSLTVGTSAFDGHNYWHGTRINIPGVGSQAMLVVNAASHRPVGSNAYWTTSAFTSVSCLPSVLNATGEGFIATTADGTRYWFNWMAMAYEQELTQQRQNGYDHLPRGAYGLYATRVEDRFGNWVTYSYSNAANAPVRLGQISASDGRVITVNHNAAGFVSSVVAHGRTWSYSYSAGTSGSLSSVVLPDSSRWSINLATLQNMRIRYYQGEPGEAWRNCGNPGEVAPLTYVGTVTHPSGAIGEFTLDIERFGRSGVTYAQNCAIGKVTDVNDDTEWYPTAWDSYALKSKKVTGPGLTPATWTYAYSQGNGTEVFGPSDYARYTYGNTFRQDEGKLLRVERGSGPTGILTSTAYTYELAQSGMPYPTPIGVSPQVRSDDFGDEYLRPEKLATIVQDGVNFNSRTNTFDEFARPLVVDKWSSLGYGKTEVAEYHHDKSKWVLGQVKRQTNANTGIVVAETYYDPATALPLWSKAFGKLQSTLGYYADGTLRTVTDGRNETTLLSNWKRGVPQRVQYPDGTGKSATVNDSGWITAVADENDFWTGYGYDAMGRLASIVYPGSDSVVWNNTTITFEQQTVPAYGLPAGYWRRWERTGNKWSLSFFDAFWRPVLEERYDAGNVVATLSQTVKRYDSNGRLVFQSYPTKSVGHFEAAMPGSHTIYDAIDRVTQVKQDSELGPLVTTTEYLTNFKTRTTNPRLHQTFTSYRAYDQPTFELPNGINHPEGASTEIYRDPLDAPVLMRRRNADGSQSASRYYVYDANRQLCKTIEPETGATVMGYDGNGNLAWSAAGLNLPNTGDCEHSAAYASGRRVDRHYNSLNRLTALRFPDGNGNQDWIYTPDGLPQQITTLNDGGTTSVINTYSYNKRRLLEGESSQQPGWYSWGLGYAYNSNGHLQGVRYPTGLYVNNVPNALGQPTHVVSDLGTYASNISYYPNGAIQQFTYGNGLTHTMTQNARQLPARASSSGGTLDFEYAYDTNANVTQISDHALGSHTSRWMTYDGLDRLTSAGSCSFGGDCWHRYTYDVLDNLTSSKLPGVKEHNYVYDTAKNRLSMVRNNAGAATMALEYDVQGNLSVKNGLSYTFDFGNRLRGVSNLETYRYDGHGRRVLGWSPNGGTILSMYGQSGQMLYQHDERTGKAGEQIYLAGSLLASREITLSNGQHVTKFHHTDALGSPVAVTNQAGQVIDRTQYEPYGAAINKTVQGIGYTGHVMDAKTGLTYMQQRYYDPTLGRFLSVDPVTANSGTGANFNRYWYANNNPYKLIDPDGRAACGKDWDCKMAEQKNGNGISKGEISAAKKDPVAFVARLNDRSNSQKSEQGSGRYFSRAALPVTIATGLEVGADITKLGEKAFSVVNFALGDQGGVDAGQAYSGPGTRVAIAHTHPGNRAFSGRPGVFTRGGWHGGFRAESDLERARYAGVNAYVGTTNGSVLRFDFGAMSKDALRAPNAYLNADNYMSEVP